MGLCMDVKLSKHACAWPRSSSASNQMPPCLWWQVVAAEGTLAQVAVVCRCACNPKPLNPPLAGGRGGGHARAGGGRGPARGRQAARGGGRGRARHCAPSRADAGAWLATSCARVWEVLPCFCSSCLLPAAGLRAARGLLQCQAGYSNSGNVLKLLFGQRWCPSAQPKECRPGQVNAAFSLQMHTSPQ